MFGIVVAITFQSVICLEMHQNNIFFYFLKVIFDIGTSKCSKKKHKKNKFKEKNNF